MLFIIFGIIQKTRTALLIYTIKAVSHVGGLGASTNSTQTVRTSNSWGNISDATFAIMAGFPPKSRLCPRSLQLSLLHQRAYLKQNAKMWKESQALFLSCPQPLLSPPPTAWMGADAVGEWQLPGREHTDSSGKRHDNTNMHIILWHACTLITLWWYTKAALVSSQKSAQGGQRTAAVRPTLPRGHCGLVWVSVREWWHANTLHQQHVSITLIAS